MTKYYAKTLFTGYKLGLKTPDLYVGVPRKKFSGDNPVAVHFAGEMQVMYENDAEAEKTFNDKFRPGEVYTLMYFLWKKVSEEAK